MTEPPTATATITAATIRLRGLKYCFINNSSSSGSSWIHRFAANELVSRRGRSWFGGEYRSEHPGLAVNEERSRRTARCCAWGPRHRRGSVDPDSRALDVQGTSSRTEG